MRKKKVIRKPRIYPINDDYRIVSDTYSLILERSTKTGKWPGRKTYHPSLEDLLRYLYDDHFKGNIGDLETMRAFKDEIIGKMHEITEAKRKAYQDDLDT